MSTSSLPPTLEVVDSHPAFQVGLLGPVQPEDLDQSYLDAVATPSWLRELGLEDSRTNVRCLNQRTRFAKRILDIVVASTLLVLTAPLIAAAALAVKLSSPGPILFSQIRVGLNLRKGSACGGDCDDQCRRQEPNYGRPFRIYKIRTMHLAASKSGPKQAKASDSRVFAVGRLLRRMRIDELPQLVNVLLGNMSMVGPRPECIEYMEELEAKVPGYSQRLGLKPGLTGIAQIESGYANDLDSYRRKAAYDFIYLQNCCVSNDLRIMYRTLKVVFTGFGAL
ncbi:MAG: hypothetical protein Aurels2KO_22060 [Aureliella sp.]